MTDETLKSIEEFIAKWAQPDQVGDMTVDLYGVTFVAVREATKDIMRPFSIIGNG